MMPVADIETLAQPQGMVAARRYPIIPRIILAAGLPLAGNPPPPDLDRFGGIGEVEDHHDVADVALGRGRDVGEAAVEIEAVHAAARSRHLRSALAGWARDVVDRKAAAELGGAAVAEPLVVDDHDAVRARTLWECQPSGSSTSAACADGAGRPRRRCGAARPAACGRRRESCRRPRPGRRRGRRRAQAGWCWSVGHSAALSRCISGRPLLFGAPHEVE